MTATSVRSPSVWLVTGASSGIGLAMVRQLHARGETIWATGRRAPSLLPDDFPDVCYIEADLVSSAGQAALLAAVPERIDVAVLNAGTGYYRPLGEEDAAAITQVFATNLCAPMALAHALHPRLSASGGTLGLVGSVAHRGAAGMPVYAASKAGLDGFGRSLASEWQGRKEGRVDVRVVHPGPTATGMAERAGLTSKLAHRLMLPVDDVAAGVLRAMRGRRRVRTVSYRAVFARRLIGAGRGASAP